MCWSSDSTVSSNPCYRKAIVCIRKRALCHFCFFCFVHRSTVAKMDPENQIITNNGKFEELFSCNKVKLQTAVYCGLVMSYWWAWDICQKICCRGLIMFAYFNQIDLYSKFLEFHGNRSDRQKQLHSVCPECWNFLKNLCTFYALNLLSWFL